jgi:hypothetical protein
MLCPDASVVSVPPPIGIMMTFWPDTALTQ